MEDAWKFNFRTDSFEFGKNGVLLSARRELGDKIGSEVYSFCVKSADCGGLQAEARYFLPEGCLDLFSTIDGTNISQYKFLIEKRSLSETMKLGLSDMFDKILGVQNADVRN